MARRGDTGGLGGSETGLLLACVGVMYFFAAILWLARPEIVGPAYRMVRMIESLGSWPLWSGGWDRVFRPGWGHAPFWSIARTSVPFGVFCALALAAMGGFAWRRVRTGHIRARAASASPPGHREIMERQAARYPANRFFLDHDLNALPLDRGVARMPERALDLLEASGAIVGIVEPPEEPGPGIWVGYDLTLEETALTAALLPALGPVNPFLTHEDGAAAVDGLPWPAAILLRACLERLQALTAEDMKAPLLAVERRMQAVWRRLNAARAELGPRLALGFDGEDGAGREAAREAWADRIGRDPREVLTLAEWLDAGDPSPGEAEAAQDRAWLKAALADPKDGGGLLALLTRHRFVSGCLATLLVRTRRAGVFAPETFRWLRFYDRPLWSFLRCVGMNTPVPLASGAFAHWREEDRAGTPIEEPRFGPAATGLRLEARKFLTPETVARLRADINARKTAAAAQAPGPASHEEKNANE